MENRKWKIGQKFPENGNGKMEKPKYARTQNENEKKIMNIHDFVEFRKFCWLIRNHILFKVSENDSKWEASPVTAVDKIKLKREHFEKFIAQIIY